MPVFEYRAVDTSGKMVRGTAFGPSLAAIADDLTKQGLSVQHVAQATGVGADAEMAGAPAPGSQSTAYVAEERSVQERVGAEAPPATEAAPPTEPRSKIMTELVGPLVGRVPLSHMLFFFRQLGNLTGAGVGLVQSLDTLGRQARDPRLKKAILEMRGHVQAGRPLSVGMQRYPEVFSPLMLSLVRAGEGSGILEQTLKQTAEYIDQEIELRNLYRRVTIYPKLLIVASILVVLATNAIIASLGKSGGLTSPLTSPAFLTFVLILAGGIFFFLRVGLHNPRVRQNWDAFILAIPYLGPTLKQLAMAKFGRAFGALYQGGVPITEAMKLSADACGNEALRAKIYPAARQLEEGGAITETLRRTQAFSPIVLDMTQTGETTGNLDQMLTKMAEFYEDEAKTRSTQLGYATGVAVLLLVAAYIGYVYITNMSAILGGYVQQGLEEAGQ